MKQILIFALSVGGLSAGISVSLAAVELTIPANSEYTITPAQQLLTLDQLTIGDNAKIIFAHDVASWSLNVERAAIGTNVTIDGRGIAGNTGIDGDSWQAPRTECGDGHHGSHGTEGGNGGQGRNITLNIGLESLGSLHVDVSGGRGGDGGNGGEGEDAGFGKTCLRANGGNGGNAGSGGNGGNGGELRLSLWSVNSAQPINRLLQRLSTSADFGIAGLGGKAGNGGAGSPSQYSNIPNITGGRRRLHAGEDGKSGDDGGNGQAGMTGSVSINTLLPSSGLPTPGQTLPSTLDNTPVFSNHKNVDAPTKEQELQQLRQQLEALQQRIEQLERQN